MESNELMDYCAKLPTNSLAREMIEQKAQKQELENKVSLINKHIAAAEQELFNRMITDETEKIVVDGYSFTPTVSKQPSILAEKKPGFFKALSRKGFSGLIKRDVNAQTFKSWYREQLEMNNGVEPKWMARWIKCFDKQGISMRKVGK